MGKLKNFQFEHEGKIYWYSRSVVTVTALFASDMRGNMCVLATKRGSGLPNEVGKWNIIAGYLDFWETVEQCAIREVHEETGVKLNEGDLQLDSINSTKDGDQNVSFRFFHVFNVTTNRLTLTKEFAEKDEVEDVKWIPLKDLDNYEWAFNHRWLIDKIINEHNIHSIPVSIPVTKASSNRISLLNGQKIKSASLEKNSDGAKAFLCIELANGNKLSIREDVFEAAEPKVKEEENHQTRLIAHPLGSAKH